MPERGREAAASVKKDSKKARSRSRVRRVKTGEEKPIGSRLKKMMKGITRKSSRSMSGTNTVASRSVAPVVSVQPPSEIMAKPQSVPPSTESTNDESHSLQLVLLLMDPETRRFELLQLEFDSNRARVVDIIFQIPISVTEPAIRQQQYEGVLGEEGTLQDQSVRLVDFCKEKQVLVALPKDIPITECLRLARPILSDNQVLQMLQTGGFDVSGWNKNDTNSSMQSRESSAQNPDVATNSDRNNGRSLAIAALVVLAIVLQATHVFLSSPIELGVALPPGTWRSKCGLLGYLPKLDIAGFEQCQNSILEVNNDGTVSLTGEDNEPEMLMVGNVCTRDDCIDGVFVNESGMVYIGGKRVKSIVSYRKDVTITPWPFKEKPKLKVKNLSVNK